jgi:hypothetical protein
MRLLAAVPAVAVLAMLVTGCSAAPAAPAGPGPRVLQESQVRVFTDRVFAEILRNVRGDEDYAVRALASEPDRTGGMYGPTPYRSEIEEKGRAVCSHLIAGEEPVEAFRAAYPRQDARDLSNAAVIKLADQVLCPKG